MRLFSHFSFDTLSNTYVVGPDGGGDALLVDPASFDVPLLEIVEGHGYYVRHVLLTHYDESHLAGLRTLRRIYDCSVYAAHATVLGELAITVSHGDRFSLCCGPIEVITLPGHSSDSVAYFTNGLLFTGTAMSAAEYGSVGNPYAKAILLANIRERVLTLPDETVVFPFYGPPSTVLVEKDTFPTQYSIRSAEPS